MAGRLVVLDRAGRAKSKSFALGSGMCTLGRGAACDIRVLLPDVSPHHATVTVHANQTVVRNVGSGTTLVNGAPVSVHALQHGDELALGGRRLRWEYDMPQAPRRAKTQPALALAAAPSRAARRGTLAAPPRAPDRDVQLALELRHRASMPATSSRSGGKQVAIVQPQRRAESGGGEGAGVAGAAGGGGGGARLLVAPHRPYRAPAPASDHSAALHTPTKATLWIESRRGRARAASLRAAPPLRLAVLRKALTPAPRATKLNVTKIQAPHDIDHTKQAAIMLMARHTPRAARRPPPATPSAPPAGPATPPAPRTPATPRTLPHAPDHSARKGNTRNSTKRSVSILEMTDSGTSRRSGAPPGPRKSALKSRPRTADSIKFDLSNLQRRPDADVLVGASVDGDAPERFTLRYSSSPSPSPAPSPRRSIHSRSGRLLESAGSPLRARAARAAAPAPASPPRPPRALAAARGSIIVQRALETSDSFATDRRTGSPRRRDLEAYSVVDLVSLDSDTSRSVYGSAGSPSRSALLGSSTPRATPARAPTTPDDAPRAPPCGPRPSRAARSRSRLDDSTGTFDSIDEDSPKSSRKVKSASKRSLDETFAGSPGTPVSVDSTSLGNLSPAARRYSRSRIDAGDGSPLDSPKDISLVSMKRSLGRKLCDSKRVSRTLNLGTSPSPTDVSLVSMNESLGNELSPPNRSSDSAQMRSSKDEVSRNASRNPQQTLSTTKRGSRSLNNSASRSPKDLNSPNSSRKSLETTASTKRGSRSRFDSIVTLESSSDMSAYSSMNSLGNTLSTTKRGSRGRTKTSITSPISAGETSTTKPGFSLIKTPKNASTNSSKQSLEKSSISKRGSRSKLNIMFNPKPAASESPKDVSVNSTRNSIASTLKRASRSKLIDSVLSSPVANALANSTRKSIKALSTSKRDSRRPVVESPFSPKALADSTRNTSSTSKRRSQLVDSVLSTPSTSKMNALANSTRESVKTPTSKRGRSQLVDSVLSSPSPGKTPASKRGSRSKLIDSVLFSSPIANALANSTRKSVKTPTSKRGRSQLVDSVLSSPSPGKTPASERGSRSKLIDSVLSSSPIADALADSTRKSVKTPTSKRGHSQLVDSVLSSPSPSKRNALAESTRRSLGKTLASKRGSRSELIDSVLSSSPIVNTLAKSTRQSAGEALATSKRGRSQLVDSELSSPSPSKTDVLVGSTRDSVGFTSNHSHSQLKNVSIESPKDLQTSRKSRTSTPSTSIRRTRSLPLESPKGDSSRISRASAISTSKRNTGGPSTSPPETPRIASPTKSPESPSKSPKSPNVSSKSKSGKTLTISLRRIDNDVSTGEITPEERGSPENAGTPVLSIRSLLDASVSDSPGPPRKRSRASEKRKMFANGNVRGSVRSGSSIVTRDTGDVTPTGVAEPTPEAVKSKHSSAKKSRSRRSIIDTLDDSGLVKHLFNSPVKRKLSHSMTEYSRRLERPAPSPDVSGVGRLLADSPRNEAEDSRAGRRASRAPGAGTVTFAAAPRDGLGDVRGVKRAFRASPDDDLRRVSGVKESFRGRKNEFDASGAKRGPGARSPKNDLRDVRGVKKLFQQPRPPTSPNVSGVARLLGEPAPAEAMFDRLVGKPPVRATYSKTFIAPAKKAAKRRRTASLGVPLDVLVNSVEQWVERELRSRVGGAGRTRGPAARSYAEHTLPLKKRSLESARPRKQPLPLKKRVVHSTPLKARAPAAAAPPPPESPIAREPAQPGAAPLRSTPISRNSPKKPKPSVSSEAGNVKEKNDIVKPSPRKTRARRAAAGGARAVRARGRARAAAAGAHATPNEVPAVKKAGAKAPTRNKSSTLKKPSNTNDTTEVAPKEPTTKASRSKKVPTLAKVASPKSPAPKRATRSKKVASPSKVTPKKSPTHKRTRGVKKLGTPPEAPKPKPKATRTKKVSTLPEVTPKKSPTPKRATRSKKIPTPGKSGTSKRPAGVAKKPRARGAAAPTVPGGGKILKSPVERSKTKKGQSPVVAPGERRGRGRGRAAAPGPRAERGGRASLVLPKHSPVLKPQPAARAKRSKNPPKESPKKSARRGRNAAAGDAPAPRVRRAPAPAPSAPKQKAPTPKRKAEPPATPESKRKKTAEVSKRGRKAAATLETKKKGAKAVETPPKKGAEAATAAKKRVVIVTPEPPSRELASGRGRGRGRGAAARARAPLEPAPGRAVEPEGKKTAALEARGRKRKLGAAAEDTHKEPSPKKPRGGRAGAPPPAASSRARRR